MFIKQATDSKIRNNYQQQSLVRRMYLIAIQKKVIDRAPTEWSEVIIYIVSRSITKKEVTICGNKVGEVLVTEFRA